METRPAPWIKALRHSHDRLKSVVEPLGLEQLEGPSYASEWSIAQVLSHLGSQAEIFALFLRAGLDREAPPGQEVIVPIWDAWNARSPEQLAADAVRIDGETVGRFESLDEAQLERFHLAMSGMEFDAAGLTMLRLGEHALHTWDIAVALDPGATLSPDAVALLVDSVGMLVGRVGKPDGSNRRVQIVTRDPERSFVLEIAEAVSLSPSEPGEGPADLTIPAESLVRLVYGRLDPDHTPVVETRGVDLDDLRRVFPGV